MRAFLADSIALLVFFTITGILNERYVAGMEWSDVLLARIIGAPLMVLTARPYGIWRDWVMTSSGAFRAGGLQATGFDTIALLSFQVPIYAAIIFMGGASVDEVIRGSLGAAAIMLITGRPYGLWLECVRRFIGASTVKP